MVSVTFAQMPVPSYDVPVTGKALFVDKGNPVNLNGGQQLIAEKRDMNVSNDGGGNGPVGGSMIVYIARVDGSIVLGPYYVAPGQTITVPIDYNLWGVAVATSQTTPVSVWTDDNGN